MKHTNEISKIVGISKRTLQFYDDEGMIHVNRTKNNYRVFDKEVLGELWEILIYKEIGLELKEIKQLLAVSDREKKRFLKGQMKELESEIKELQERIRFISKIVREGLPEIPKEQDKVPYTKRITEIKARAR